MKAHVTSTGVTLDVRILQVIVAISVLVGFVMAVWEIYKYVSGSPR